jgi:hypothetical protein
LDINSPTHDSSQYQPQQQLLFDANLRKLVQKIVHGLALPIVVVGKYFVVAPVAEVPGGKQKDSGVKGGLTGKDGSQAAVAALNHIDGIESACKQLKVVNLGLASLFEEHYGIWAYGSGHKVSGVFQELFVQVRTLKLISEG